jgi:hypothetical protein
MILKCVKEAKASETSGADILGEFPINHHAVCIENKVRIRTYRKTDRPAIRNLCCETGFLGNPVDGLFRDRELFADLFTNAYLQYEPDWALVAEVDGRVIGYLLGAVSRHFDLTLMRSGFLTASKMIFRLASGRYSGHPRSLHFVRWLFTSGFWEQPKHPADAAHLHWDLERGFRGRGVCKRLWEVYERKLQRAGIKRCYGAFFSYPKRRPESVYARYGFRVYDRKRTSIFDREISGPVDVVCVHKEI